MQKNGGLSCGALILAAGSGRRMSAAKKKNANENKLFLEIDGIPTLAHTLLAFEVCGVIDKIVLATRECDIPLCKQIAEDFGISKLVSIICGGDERQQSVEKGLAELVGKCGLVAIHDGARCLIEPSDIERTVREAHKFGAASLALPCTDTLKKSGSDMCIEVDIERAGVYRVQTPQVFQLEAIAAAHKKAAEDGFAATDDCSVATHAGIRVRLVEGSVLNMKLTTADDLELMEAVAAHRRMCRHTR